MNGKICVVTGASGGIGYAVAKRLVEAGGVVAICARDDQRVHDAVHRLTASSGRVVGQACDVSDEAQVDAFATFVRDALGAPDVLVNNAGVGCFGPVLELTTEQIDRTLAVNVRGVFLVTRAFLPDMITRRSGDIVNVASLAGKNGFVGGTAYSASKHAVMGMSKSLMLEVRGHGVRVTAVCPGSVDTPFFDKAGRVPEHPDRLLTPDDVARAITDCLALGPQALISELDIRPANP